MGIPDLYVEHGSPKELYAEIGIDAFHIAETVRGLVNSTMKVEAFTTK